MWLQFKVPYRLACIIVEVFIIRCRKLNCRLNIVINNHVLPKCKDGTIFCQKKKQWYQVSSYIWIVAVLSMTFD